MKRRIVLALCVAVGIGLTLMMPEVQVHSADKEQRFPLLKLEQLNDQQAHRDVRVQLTEMQHGRDARPRFDRDDDDWLHERRLNIEKTLNYESEQPNKCS